jgi:hypothetical protein
MSDTFVSWMIWWFSLFGITDFNYVKLGITLLATAALLTVLWLIVIIFFAVVGTMFEGKRNP